MSDWRPIKTAPRDGTRIMSWDGKNFAVIAWSTRDEHWFLDDADAKEEWKDVTHWMPLPAPPEAA